MHTWWEQQTNFDRLYEGNHVRTEHKERLSDCHTLILGSILYLLNESDLNFFEGLEMFEKSDAHMVGALPTRFLDNCWILADKVNHDFSRSSAYYK